MRRTMTAIAEKVTGMGKRMQRLLGVKSKVMGTGKSRQLLAVKNRYSVTVSFLRGKLKDRKSVQLIVVTALLAKGSKLVDCEAVTWVTGTLRLVPWTAMGTASVGTPSVVRTRVKGYSIVWLNHVCTGYGWLRRYST